MPAKTYTCRSCGLEFVRPEDHCTKCGDRLFWLLLPKHKLDEGSLEVFAASMSRVVNKTIPKAYLTHGGRIWLPDGFWRMDPSGDSLRNFPWIGGLRLFQHEKSKSDASTPATSKPQATPAPAPVSQPKPRAAANSPKPLQPKPIMDQGGNSPNAVGSQPPQQPAPDINPANQAINDTEPDLVKPLPNTERKPERRPQSQAQSEDRSRIRVNLQKRHWFVPVMIFILFVFLSLSYLSLRYHKNTRAVAAVIPYEVSCHEHTILS